MVDPPTVDETIQILKGLRSRYEAHHRVKITDEAIEAAARLSDRYISGRFLPDKAIDVIDETSSKVRLSTMTAPPDLKNLENEIRRLSKEKEQAVNNQNFEEAARLRDEEHKAKERLEEIKNQWRKRHIDKEITIGEEDVAEVIASWTGIPMPRLEEKESERLLRMEKEIHKRVVGQDEAVSAIANAVRRSRTGLKNPKRPIGSFIFLGPTGVGKTLLARALAEFMFGSEDALLQLDMSEYMEKFNVSKLIGAPPGYVGYEEGGQLTERVRRKPYSVILLDEIEKAHPDVFNMLLQVLEEGRLTDSFGRHVDFRNTILIMTSNVGADLIRKRGSLGFKVQKEELSYQEMKEKLMDEVKKTFKPEFLNRIDDVIVFHPLSREDLEKIVEIEVREVKERLKEQDVTIELTKEAKDFLINKGFDPTFGARPLKRTISRYLEDPLAQSLLRGEIQKNQAILVKVKDDRLIFENKSK